MYTKEGNALYLSEISKVNEEVMQLKSENQKFKELVDIVRRENDQLKSYMLKVEDNIKLSMSLN